MLKITAAVTVLFLTLQTSALNTRTRLSQRHDPAKADAGLGTLEVVVLALGFFLLAGIAVAAVTAATNSRLAQIR